MSGFLWQGRMAEGPDKDALAFESSIGVDARLAEDDIRGSRAHVRMLAKVGLLPRDEAARIDAELSLMAGEIAAKTLIPGLPYEDIHSFVEGKLTERTDGLGKKLHAGRSRNDQVALDERLYLRRALPALADAIASACLAIACRAEEHAETPMPGYTHMQRAQPVTLGHHLMAWAWMLLRDHGRVLDALARADSMPLGSGALAGSGLGLDRAFVAAELGFGRLTENSMDAVADRDYCSEAIFCAAMAMTHLSRFCEEIVLWTTEEFGFASLPERWSTGSSIMPQKKNPDYAELIRGRAGRVYGDLVASLTMQKGLPLSYNRDLQEDKEGLFDALDTAISCLEIFAGMAKAIEFRPKRMAEAARGGYSNATDLADYLVRKGMPFRSAHEVAAKAVRECIDRGIDLGDMTLDELKAHSALFDVDIFRAISLEEGIAARNLPGGPAPESVRAQIRELRNRFKAG